MFDLVPDAFLRADETYGNPKIIYKLIEVKREIQKSQSRKSVDSFDFV